MSRLPYASDTSANASGVQLQLWSKMTGQQRVQKAMALSSQLHSMAFDAIQRRHPEWDDSQVQLKFIELAYGRDLAMDFER